jgi:hypothetical protein
MRSGRTFAKKDFTRKGRETPLGVSDISTCPIRMGMSCRLHGRYRDLHEFFHAG